MWRVSRISVPGAQTPAEVRKSRSSPAPWPIGSRPRSSSASSSSTGPCEAAPRSLPGSMPVSRTTASGTERPGSTNRSSRPSTRSGVKATAPTSMTRS